MHFLNLKDNAQEISSRETSRLFLVKHEKLSVIERKITKNDLKVLLLQFNVWIDNRRVYIIMTERREKRLGGGDLKERNNLFTNHNDKI